MSKTQAFKAFELIMRCLFQIMYWTLMRHNNEYVEDDKRMLHKIEHDYVEFMLKEFD